MQINFAINAIIPIPDRLRNPGAANTTCAYTICNQLNAKMWCSGQKKSQIYHRNFFVFKMKTEKCSILIGPQDRFFKMKINDVAQALHRKTRIQQFGQSAILGIFCSGLNQKLTHNPNFKFCLVLRFFFKFLNIPRGGGKNYFFYCKDTIFRACQIVIS